MLGLGRLRIVRVAPIRSGNATSLSRHPETVTQTQGAQKAMHQSLLASAVFIATWRPWNAFAQKARSSGLPRREIRPQHYNIIFAGKSLWREREPARSRRSNSIVSKSSWARVLSSKRSPRFVG